MRAIRSLGSLLLLAALPAFQGVCSPRSKVETGPTGPTGRIGIRRAVWAG